MANVGFQSIGYVLTEGNTLGKVPSNSSSSGDLSRNKQSFLSTLQ